MKLAAVSYEAGGGHAIDRLLVQLARELRGHGYKLAGAVQWNEPRANDSRCAMVLEDLATGERLDVSADPNTDPSACRLNSYALEDVAGRVAGSIGPGVDLVILNRFGKQEAARAGFRAIIEAAVAHELPVITGLNVAHKALWDEFTTGDGAYLNADPAAVNAWAVAAIADKASRS